MNLRETKEAEEVDYEVNHLEVSTERLDGEVIAIHFGSGKYFAFRQSAADLLFLLQNKIARSQWFEGLRGHFSSFPEEENFQREVKAFLDKLLSEGLIVETSSTDNRFPTLPMDWKREHWSTPNFSVNDELVDLLVIDPIHDTSGGGWPEAEPSN